MSRQVPAYVAEADRIMQRLRDAVSLPEIEAIANEERANVRHLHDQDCDTQKSLAMGIVNLKLLRINQLKREARA